MAEPTKSMDYAILNLIEVLERKGLLKLSARRYQTPSPRYRPDDLLRPPAAAAVLRTPARWRVSGLGPRYIKISRTVSSRIMDPQEFLQGSERTRTRNRGEQS
ncbi:hypothetical protein NKI32_28360 [Mesorhizobium sp. M0761]|uniref:hypothetical protein n=1 Tax=Mesorhizobium sp. M0761 TaxID=2956994 RepID=UPI00333C742E